MDISEVRIRRIEQESKLKAVASITIDNAFVIHDIKVIEGDNGLFIAMPSKKGSDGEFRDICHPISSSVRDELKVRIIEEYNKTN